MRDVLLLLRLPFSLLLLPVFLFALSQATNTDETKTWWVFLILHLLLFPASNAFNSYYDKDLGSIGLLSMPPKPTRALLWTALGLDALAIFLAIYAKLGLFFIGYLLIYGTVSKIYSHPYIRLKKYPIASWLVIGVFQGFYTYLAVFLTIQSGKNAFPHIKAIFPAIICAVNLLAAYPLTQVYQHKEDAEHGDNTISRLVGIRGTFWLASLLFGLSFLLFAVYFILVNELTRIFLLGLCFSPAMMFYVKWWQRVHQNVKAADFENTMKMNILTAGGLTIFFAFLIIIPNPSTQ